MINITHYSIEIKAFKDIYEEKHPQLRGKKRNYILNRIFYMIPLSVWDESSIELYRNEIFITTPNSARALHPKRKPTYDVDEVVDKDMVYIDTVSAVYWSGKFPPKDGTEIASMGNGEDIILTLVGDEIVQTNIVGLPEWRVSRTIYFKYYWLFYIVAKDYWDKYPDDIYIESIHDDCPFSEEERKELLEKEKPLFDEGLIQAKKNYPEFTLAEEMVEEKKKEGTYWSELEAVYLESKRLKENLGKEVDETNTN